MTNQVSNLVDRLTAALVDQHLDWTIEEVTEAAQRAIAHEALTSG